MKSVSPYILIPLLILLAAFNILPQQHKVIIKACVSELPGGSDVYITGNTDELGNWSLMRPMQKNPKGEWLFYASVEKGDSLLYKFTRGAWDNEAVDSNGIEFPNFVLVVQNDTLLVHKISNWRDKVQQKIIITPERFANKSRVIELIEGWKYHTGDDSDWAKINYDDSQWKNIVPLLTAKDFYKIKWTGNLWFRTRIYVDSSFWNKPFGFVFESSGAADIYLNGKFIYSIGKIGSSVESEKIFTDRTPRYIIFNRTENILAIRYSNHSAERMIAYNLPAGFNASLSDLNGTVSGRISIVRQNSILQLSFTFFLLAFSIMHFLLYVFYRQARENLFYSISMLGFAGLIYTSSSFQFETSMLDIINMALLNTISIHLSILFGLLTVYTSSYGRMPKQSIFFIILSLLFVIQSFLVPYFNSGFIQYAFYIYVIVVAAEILRVVLRSARRKEPWGWGWIIGVGFLIAMVFIGYQILILTDIVTTPLFGVRLVYVYGIIILAITVSINLSKKVAVTTKNLELQLIQVKELSDKTIEQERKAKEEELSRKLLKADNDRKTKELDEARSFQLSMLPKKIPRLENLEIEVYMKPATEVGGDYYDFKYDSNGNLIIAVGDATGHGMKAGTMVAAIKGLFTAEQITTDISDFLAKSNTVIKDMMLGNIFMAMLIVKMKNNKAVFSSAGMPPSLVYRNSTGEIEEIKLRAMPLGSPIDLKYAQQEIFLEKGDTILLMSDGFPELFNEQKEILGYDSVKNIFGKIAFAQPGEIIRHLCREVDKWKANADQEDDITFVVVKVK